LLRELTFGTKLGTGKEEDERGNRRGVLAGKGKKRGGYEMSGEGNGGEESVPIVRKAS